MMLFLKRLCPSPNKFASSLRKFSSQDTIQRIHNGIALKSTSIGEGVAFSFQWLRDNCQCNECIHPSTRQKMHSSGAISENLEPESISIAHSTLSIEWQRGSIDGCNVKHMSSWPISWLIKNSFTSPESIENLEPVLWAGADFREESSEFCYDDLMNNKDTLNRFYLQLSKYGLAFVNNTPKEHQAVESIALLVGPIRETFYGRTWDVVNLVDPKNIAYTSLFLGPHMDLMYFESPPGLQFLHALENSVEGGMSYFIDAYYAVRLLREISPESYDILTSTQIKYHYDNNGHKMSYSHPLIDISNKTMRLYYAPQFQAPMNIDPSLAPEFYKAFKIWEGIIHKPEMKFTTLLKEGRCVVFVNRRILHARDSFVHSSGKRYLKGTYVDWDYLNDKIRVLS